MQRWPACPPAMRPDQSAGPWGGGDPYGNVENVCYQRVTLSRGRLSPIENIGGLYRLSSEKPPPDPQEKAPIPASLAANGIGAGTTGGEANRHWSNSAIEPFCAISDVAREALAALDSRPRIAGTLSMRWPS